MSERRRKDGIAEILASRRAPGAIIRGNGHVHPVQHRTRVDRRVSGETAEQLEARENRIFKAKRERALRQKAEQRGQRKRDGHMKHIGYMPMEQYRALQNELGAGCMKEGAKELFRRTGRLFGTD